MWPARTASCPTLAGMSEHDTRYGQRSGSGSNEPKRHEKKEQREDWVPRQGGDQTRGQEDRTDPRQGAGNGSGRDDDGGKPGGSGSDG